MSRLTNLIKEVLSTQPKKKDCNCGCNTCDNVGNEGILLNESKAPKMILSENLQYHVRNKLPLTENTFRYGSESFLNLWQEARYLYLREIIHVNEDDKEILSETDLGNYGMYEGEKVPLDLPMSDEDIDPETLQNEFEKEFNVRTSLIGGEKLSILIRGDIYEEFDDMVDFIESKGFKVNADLSNFEYEREFDDDRAYYPFIIFSQDSINEAREPLKDISKEYLTKDMNLIKESDLFIEVSIDKDKIKIDGGQEITDTVKDIQGYRVKTSKRFYETPREVIEALKDIKGRYYKYSITLEKTEFEEEEEIINYTFYLTPNGIREPLNEAKTKKKKDPPIGKPKRGGPKAYYVYVRNPKTKKIKKVTFGSGGLKAKINNPKARRAFAARHKCAQKKDRTKASYWSCRLPRYAKLLGLKSSFSGFW